MTTPDVLAVVLNWKRPMNIPAILEALRAQTVPVYTLLVECSYGTEYVCHAWRKFDDCIRLGKTNLGPCSRFIPAMAYTGFRHTFFAVDDYIPGPRCVESMLRTADAVQGEFSTIGQDGRLVEGESLIKRRIRLAAGKFLRVDVSTTSELVRTDLIPHAIGFRNRMAANHPEVSLFEDDMILCMGLQAATGFPSILTPDGPADESWRSRRLDAPHALSARPDHQARRDEFTRCAQQLGWRSIA